MFARMLACVYVLAGCASVRALDISEDYVVRLDNLQAGESIHVHDDATLTLDFSQDTGLGVGPIVLWDNAKLIVRSGQVNGEIQIRGDNRLDLRGGRFTQRITGSGDASITIRGGQFSGLWSFTDGTQNIRMLGGRGVGLSGESISLDFYSPYPLYSQDAAKALLAGFTSRVPTISTSTASVTDGVKWRMHSVAFEEADSNRDGVVDVEDMNLVRNSFGRTFVDLFSSYRGETLPYDGRVDVLDLNRVRNSFGIEAELYRASSGMLHGAAPSRPPGGDPTSVPEPEGLALAVIGIVAAACLIVRNRARRCGGC